MGKEWLFASVLLIAGCGDDGGELGDSDAAPEDAGGRAGSGGGGGSDDGDAGGSDGGDGRDGGMDSGTDALDRHWGAFTWSIDKAQDEIVQGQTTTFVIESSGWPEPGSSGVFVPVIVTLDVGGLPSGVTARFAPAELSSGETFSGLTLTTSDALAPGSYPFTVTGTTMSADGSMSTKQLEATLVVTAGFTLATFPAAGVEVGSSVTVRVFFAPTQDFGGEVTLSLEDAPSGITASFVPSAVSGSDASSMLTLSTTGSAAPGKHRLELRGAADSGEAASTTLDLAVVSAADSGEQIVSLDSSGTATCAVRSNGQVVCWGGYEPILGTAFTSEDTTGTYMITSDQVFARVVVGSNHACALNTAGNLYCWGMNNFGQFGDGTKPTDAVLTAVPGGGGMTFADAACGLAHMCGLDPDGNAYCWGDETSYQLGVDPGPFVYGTPTPQAVGGAHTFTKLALSSRGSCGVGIAGNVLCWGQILGLIDDPPMDADAAMPIDGAFGLKVETLAYAGESACGLTRYGLMYCWGAEGGSASFGQGVFINHAPLPPGIVRGDYRFQQFDTEAGSTCALDLDGKPYCWGDASRLGTGEQVEIASHDVQAVIFDRPFIAITVGGDTVCGATMSGEAYCWGYNGSGALGIAKTGVDNDIEREPVQIFAP